MAEISSFRAIRYSLRDLSRIVAPPYDILDAKDKESLLARDAHNIVAIDLPFVPAKTAGPRHVYDDAAAKLSDWLADGTLRRDAQPAIYVYHQVYSHGGRSYTRQMFFARLRLEEFGQGQVFPHEQTFGGPKEDRLMLMRATSANLSPIFGLYPDERREVSAAFDAAIQRAPDAVAVAEQVENRLWAVTDAAVCARVASLLRDKPVFIADGHHRYGTALMYRNELAARGALPDDHPATFVLCVLAGMEDPGLLILPTHRVLYDLPRVTIAALREALHDRFEVAPARDAKNAGPLTAQMQAFGPQAMAAYAAADDLAMLLAPKDPDLLKEYEPGRAPAWRRYSLAILHRYVLNEVIARGFTDDGHVPQIHYIKDTAGAISEAKAHQGLALLVQSTTMSELRDICTAGELMPQKSTYFFPKLATGMVINPLDA